MSQDGNGRATDGPDEEVGTVTEEAAKLFGALSEWARDHGSELGLGVAGLAGQAASSARAIDEHLATGSAECTYCPICRTVHAIRQTSPEVRAQLSTAATSLLRAAAGLLATAVPDERGHRAGVERIDLDEPDDWPDEAGDTGPGEEER